MESLDWTEGIEGGYKVNPKKDIPGKYQCPICHLPMRNPIQTYRGEMACESCYLTARGDSQICPIDGEPIDDGEEFFKDRHAQKEILQLPVYCDNQIDGCNWEGVIKTLEQHKSTCDYERIACLNCQELVSHKDMEVHLQVTCQYRKLVCTHCGIIMNAFSMEEHEKTCDMKPTQCPYLCGETIQLNSVYDHVQVCPKIVDGVVCPYQLVGCDIAIENGLDQHLEENKDKHALLAVLTVKNLKESNEKMKHDLMTEQNLRGELADKIKERSKSQKVMEADLISWQEKYQEVNADIACTKDLSDTAVKQVEQCLNQMDLKTNGVDAVDTTLKEVERRYVETKERLENKTAGSSGSFFLEDDITKAVQTVDDLEKRSALLNANLSDLDLKLQLLENTCYDGQQFWKVDNVTFREAQAKSGKVSALHSAPCFQKRGGYKFCSRLYLNGDGMGRGTHVSLFFVLMKSEYDALLQWPFSQRVTFRLINPHNTNESVVESFLPDQKSSSFKQPTKDMNIAAGCPMFLKKEMLRNYIVDDVLYIETRITPN